MIRPSQRATAAPVIYINKYARNEKRSRKKEKIKNTDIRNKNGMNDRERTQ
jgi:hypothetical protein